MQVLSEVEDPLDNPNVKIVFHNRLSTGNMSSPLSSFCHWQPDLVEFDNCWRMSDEFESLDEGTKTINYNTTVFLGQL